MTKQKQLITRENTDTQIPADDVRSTAITNALNTSIEAPKRIGLIMLFLTFGVFGIWASTAPIDGAARAPGVVSVKSYKKIVQHLEGGIVENIFVQDGDEVRQGDALLEIDTTQSAAQLEIAEARYVAYKTLEARLIAERDNLESISFPGNWSRSDELYNEEISSQVAIFNSKKAAFKGNVEVLEQRIEQLRSQLSGLQALRESKTSLALSFEDELKDINILLSQGFSDKTRLRNLERNVADYRGQAAQLTAQIASTNVQIGEAQIQILQLEREKQNQTTTELGNIQTTLNEVNEQIVALEDVVNRALVTAPVSGAVNGMQVHTIGGVIGPGGLIAEVVPLSEELILDARVSPVDIDRVFVGQEATIRFSSFGSRTPTISGSLIHLSADTISNQTDSQPYYLARIEVSPEGLANLGDLELLPGMPAEAFIATGSRTLLQYMIKPLADAAARSFIED